MVGAICMSFVIQTEPGIERAYELRAYATRQNGLEQSSPMQGGAR